MVLLPAIFPLIAPRITPHLRIQAANEICPHDSNAKTLSKFVVNAHFKCAERKQDKHKTINDSCNLLISFTGIGGTIMIQTEKGQKEGLRMISDTETYIYYYGTCMHMYPLKTNVHVYDGHFQCCIVFKTLFNL